MDNHQIKMPLDDIVGDLDGTAKSKDDTLSRITSKFSSIRIPSSLSAAGISGPELRSFVLERIRSVRSWATFVHPGNFTKPTNFTKLKRRIPKNLIHFQSNYFIVFVILILYCFITSPLLLLVVAFGLGGCYVLKLWNQEQKFLVCKREIKLNHQYIAVLIITLILLHLAGAGGVLFWSLGGTTLVILAHSMFFSIESIVPDDPDPESFEEELTNMESVWSKDTLKWLLSACACFWFFENSLTLFQSDSSRLLISINNFKFKIFCLFFFAWIMRNIWVLWNSGCDVFVLGLLEKQLTF